MVRNMRQYGNRFVVVYEGDMDVLCEWQLFTVGRRCHNEAPFAMLDTHDRSDPSYPEGFHQAHGCYEHIAFMLEITEQGE